MSAFRTPCLVILFAIAAIGTASAQYSVEDTLKAVAPGLVYKEYSRTIEGGNLWRVTDPDATYVGDPLNSPSTYLPNPVLPLTVGDLQGAVRAVAVIDCWGGHVGTIDKQFSVNGNSWLDIPSIANTPGSPECYIQQYTVEVEIPLGDLVEGTNNFQGTSGGQSCFGWGWGQWGWYGILVRIYYDPVTKTPPTGAVIVPAPGGTIGENAILEASAASATGISRIDFLGYYDDYDVDGDGVYLDWQQSYHRLQTDNFMTLRNHMGTVFDAPYATNWDNTWITDQPAGGMKILARIQDVNGLWYVTDHVTGITLDRPGVNVHTYKATNVPSNYWVRIGALKSSDFVIDAEHDLLLAQSARMHVGTWNGVSGEAELGQDHWTRINGWQTPEFGEDHFYSYDTIDVPTNILQSGTNTVEFMSESSHHGAEIMWPGPGVTVRYVDYSNVAALVLNQPEDALAVEGATATFTVSAGGAEPIAYQWQRNGIDIPGANGPSYTTPPVTETENGDLFRCEVSNFLGSELSSEAALSVLVTGVRITDGQVALYDFNEGAGDTIRDKSGFGDPVDLVIADTTSVSWLPGALSVDTASFIASTEPAAKIGNAVISSNALTVEAWLKPANLTQNGPARIISMSFDPGTRNVTVGQGVFDIASNLYDVRLRTTATGNNGTPSLHTPVGDLTTLLTHVVFTRSVAGQTRIYIDGQESADGFAAGDFSNWDPSYLMILANEATGDRPWLGQFHLVAVFDRALTYADVLQNYLAGPEPAGEIHASVFPAQPLAGPVSLMTVPDGSGAPLTAAQLWNGVPGSPPLTVDATIAVQLLDGSGQPVVGFPADRITVASQSGGWSQCSTAPLFADAPTDGAGMTTISGSLPVGGHSSPGELLQIVVDDPQLASTTYPDGLAGLEYQINSPDVAGDMDINLTDVADVAVAFSGGAYDYALDFVWDGIINLSDVTGLSQHYGAACPPGPEAASATGGTSKRRSGDVISVAFDTAGNSHARALAPGERVDAYVLLQGQGANSGIEAFDLRLRASDNVIVHERSFMGEGLNLGTGDEFVVGLAEKRKSASSQALVLVHLVVSVTDNVPAYFWLEPSRKSQAPLPTFVSQGRIHEARPISGDVAQPLASLNDDDFAVADRDFPLSKLTLGVAPNPFNPMTEIRFSLPAGGPVDLRIFDARGQLVTVLANEVMAAGAHKVVWPGTDRSGRTAASGVYFARLKTESGELLEKMMLLK